MIVDVIQIAIVVEALVEAFKEAPWLDRIQAWAKAKLEAVENDKMRARLAYLVSCGFCLALWFTVLVVISRFVLGQSVFAVAFLIAGGWRLSNIWHDVIDWIKQLKFKG